MQHLPGFVSGLRGRRYFCLLAVFVSLTFASRVESVGPVILPGGTKTHWVIGVLAIRGPEDAYSRWNQTFATFLSDELSHKFDPKITFSMVPLDFIQLYEQVEKRQVDFLFVNPSAFSCLESEHGLASLATLRARLSVGEDEYEVSEFGGVIFARSDRTDISELAHIKGKIFASASISGLGSGQAQFRELSFEGLSFVMDPAQAIFTSNQGLVVQLVLDGRADVGFVRTGQVEGMVHDGKLQASDLKFINVVPNDEGSFFPLPTSTSLYPEWNLASTVHVPWRIQREVQRALLDMDQTHAAAQAARAYGWRPTVSYMGLRDMQRELSLIAPSGARGQMQCGRSSTLYESVVCPDGYYKRSREDVETSCQTLGRDCPEGMQCLCSPCHKGFEVNVFPSLFAPSNRTIPSDPCRKMSVCVLAQQLTVSTISVVDHVEREHHNLTYHVLVNNELEAQGSGEVIGAVNEGATAMAFTLSIARQGIHLLEVKMNGEQISQSPFLIEIAARDCSDAANGGGDGKEAQEDGSCACASLRIDISGACVPVLPLVLGTVIPTLVIAMALLYAYKWKMQRQAESFWRIAKADIVMESPPEVLGRGTFGLVIRGNYRGTDVAIKRVMPPAKAEQRPAVAEPPTPEPGSPLGASVRFSGSHTALAGSVSSFISGGIVRKLSAEALGIANDIDVDSLQSDEAGCCGLRRWGRRKLYQDFMDEMRILSKLRHPCITTVIGSVVGEEVPLLVMEIMDNGSLYDVLHNNTVEIDGEMIFQVVRDVVSGVYFLHAASPPIVHGDIKSQNILVDQSFRAKVSDFGLSQKKKLRMVGTPLFMAPEVLRGELPMPAADTFSFSVMLCEIFSREEPYKGQDEATVIAEVVAPKGAEKKRCGVPPEAPPRISEIIQECWEEDPENRPAFMELDWRLKRMDAAAFAPVVQPGLGQNKMQRAWQMRRDSNIKMGRLLDDVFPPHVAQALAEGKKVEPERREMVTIFFSDIVGFTTLCSQMDAAKVASMLDRLYSAFDALSRQHRVFKVGTIGDAYLAITNLVEDQDADHAARIANFAVAAMDHANQTLVEEGNEAMGYVRIRVGIHSGPVVANVVGSRNPRYCLFGDTVNTASRMESTSEEGRIQMSEEAARRLRRQDPSWHMVSRGLIDVKGKGRMRTFWLSEQRRRPNSGKSRRSLTEAYLEHEPARTSSAGDAPPPRGSSAGCDGFRVATPSEVAVRVPTSPVGASDERSARGTCRRVATWRPEDTKLEVEED